MSYIDHVKLIRIYDELRAAEKVNAYREKGQAIIDGYDLSIEQLDNKYSLKVSDRVVGYCAYMLLTNGFEKYLYMTVEEVEKHAKKYSKTYAKGFGKWKDDFNAMALKTVLKLLISKWGILSIEMINMQTALEADQSVVKQDTSGNVTGYEYNDNTIDVEKVQVDSPTEDEFQEYLKREALKEGTE